MVRISAVFFKIRKIARFYDLDHIITTTIITTGNLPKFHNGLQILAVRGFQKPIEEISTLLRGLQLQKLINEIRTSGSHYVRFRCSATLSKTFQPFAQMCTAITLLDKLEV